MSGFTEEEMLVRQTLGFKPKQFLRDVSSMVDSTLVNAVATYRRELLAIANTKGYVNITPEVINDSCEDLLEKMKAVYFKNMDKFELYAMRNIFTLPSPEESSAVSESRQSLEEVCVQVDGLRKTYLDAQAQHNLLKYECDESEKLLKDMKTALFNLRVGSQVLDEQSVRPISGTTEALNKRRTKLDEVCQKASSLVKQMEEVIGADESMEAASNDATGIKTGNAIEIGQITESMR